VFVVYLKTLSKYQKVQKAHGRLKTNLKRLGASIFCNLNRQAEEGRVNSSAGNITDTSEYEMFDKKISLMQETFVVTHLHRNSEQTKKLYRFSIDQPNFEGHLIYSELNTMSHYDCRVSDPYLFIAHLHIATSKGHHSPLVIIHAIFYTGGFPFKSSCGFRLLLLRVSQFPQFFMQIRHPLQFFFQR
jgi:hypothetical protein